jgi:hypothetical protein
MFTAQEAHHMKTILVRLALGALTLATLAGCASDPRHSKGLQWVVDQQSERERLEAQGFPQYAHD